MPENPLSLSLPCCGYGLAFTALGPFLYTFKVEDPLSQTKETSTGSLSVATCLHAVSPPRPRTTVPAGKVVVESWGVALVIAGLSSTHTVQSLWP